MSGYTLEVSAQLHAALQQTAHDALRFAGVEIARDGLQGLQVHMQRLSATQALLQAAARAAQPKPAPEPTPESEGEPLVE